MKYGIRDYRGGGRSSARETAARVAAGAVARKVMPGVTIRGALVQMGPHADRPRPLGLGRGVAAIRSSARTPEAAAFYDDYLDGLRKEGSSIGAVHRDRRRGRAAGPRRARSTASSMRSWPRALMSINAVKGVEIGDGFAAAALRGEENADEMRAGNAGAPTFLSNHAGGILGGISTGQPVVCRFAVKPTSSILTPRASVTRKGARDRGLDEGPARSLRRHPRRAGRRGDGGLRLCGPILCATAAREEVGVSSVALSLSARTHVRRHSRRFARARGHCVLEQPMPYASDDPTAFHDLPSP